MKKFNLNHFVKPELKDFKPYSPSPTLEEISKEENIPIESIIKLDTGENPYMENLLDKNILSNVNFFTYPDPSCKQLKQELSKYLRVPPSWIVCGNGSDELIDIIIKTFISLQDEVIINPPTFPMYEFYTKLAGGKIKPVLRNNNFIINTKEILKSITLKVKLVFIDTPGNPTGALTDFKDIEKILKKNCIAIVDEAYFEYYGKTAIPFLQKYQNLIVLRTFSKWSGLAGLRIGYAVANPQIITLLESVKSPYNVNSLAQGMGIFVLKNKEKILKKLNSLTKKRNYFTEELSKIPSIKAYPSSGAYIIFQPSDSALELQKFLRKNGILVKYVNQPLLQNSIRINICGEKEIKHVICAIKKYYGKN